MLKHLYFFFTKIYTYYGGNMSFERKYYEKTNICRENKLLTKLFNEYDVNIKNALDIGCGAGKDTYFLIKRGIYTTAIDKENTQEFVFSKLDESDLIKLLYKKIDVLDFNFQKYDLVNAMNSLSFLPQDKFKEVWEKIINSIENSGYFVR